MELTQNDPSTVALYHIQIITLANEELSVAFSIILLQRLFIQYSENVPDVFSKEVNDLIIESLPNLFINEQFTQYLLGLLAKACSTIVPMYLKVGLMMDFIERLTEIALQAHPVFSEASIDCLVQLCIQEIKLFNEEKVINILSNALQANVSTKLIIVSIRLLFAVYEQSIYETVQEFAPIIAKLYPMISEADDSKDLRIALSDLFFFCRQKYLFFSDSFDYLFESLMTIIQGNYTSQSQLIAMDTLITISVKEDVNFISYLERFTIALFQSSSQVSEDILETDDVIFSDRCLEKLFPFYIMKTNYLDLVLRIIQDFINRQEWQYRRSALKALEILVNTCSSSIYSSIEEITNLIYSYFKDEHHICRYHAFCAFSQICLQFDISFISDQYFSDIGNIISQEPYFKSQTVEINSLYLFCKSCSKQLYQYGESLLIFLKALVENSNLEHQIIAIKCFALVAEIIQIDISEQYVVFIKFLTELLENDSVEIRIRAMATIPKLGQAVGIEIFADDAINLIEMTSQINLTHLEIDEINAYVDFWIKIIKIVPDIVLPCIRLIFEQILVIAFQIPNRSEFPMTCDLTALTDMFYSRLSQQNIIVAFEISQMKQITKGFKIIYLFINVYQDYLIEFFERIIEVALDRIIKYDVYPPLQFACIDVLLEIEQTYKKTDRERLFQYLPWLQKKLLSLMNSPISLTTKIIQVLTVLMKDGYETQCPDSNFSGSFCAVLNVLLIQYDIKRGYLIHQKVDLNSQDISMFDQSEVVLAEWYSLAMECYPLDVSAFTEILLKTNSPLFRLIINTEYTLKYAPQNLNSLLELIFEQMNSQRFNLVKHSFLSLAKVLNAFPIAAECIESAKSKAIELLIEYGDDESDLIQNTCESIIFCLTVLMKKSEGVFDPLECIELWFNSLPLQHDTSESSIVYDYLCDLVEEQSTLFTDDHIPKILEIFSKVLTYKLPSREVKNRINLVVKCLCENNQDLYQKSISKLCLVDRRVITSIMIDA